MLIPLIGVFFNMFRRFNKKWVYGVVVILFFLTSVHAINSAKLINPTVNPDMISALGYFGEESEEGACLITIPDWGGMAQYYAKRSSYVSSTNQKFDRFDKLNEFLFTNKSYDINISNSYVGLMPDDFRKIDSMIILFPATMGPIARPLVDPHRRRVLLLADPGRVEVLDEARRNGPVGNPLAGVDARLSTAASGLRRDGRGGHEALREYRRGTESEN